MSLAGVFTYYWKMDEASGVAASSASAADLTATNSPVGVAGKVNNGREFVIASSQQLTRAMILGFSYNADFSILGWVKPAATSGFQGIFQKNAPGASFRLFISGTSYSQDWSGGPSYTGTSAFSAGAWKHVGLSYFGTGDKKLRTYFDGTLVNTSSANAGTQSDSDAGQSLYFGSLGGGNYLGGVLDEWGVAQSVLSDAQFLEHRDLTNANASYPFAGLLRHPGMGGGMAELLGGMRA